MISLKKYQFLKKFNPESLTPDQKQEINEYEAQREAERIERNKRAQEVEEENKIAQIKNKPINFIPLDRVKYIFDTYYLSIFKKQFEYTAHNREAMENIFLYFGKNPEFEKRGYSLKKGLGLFGPPGVGKTTILQTFEQIGKDFYKEKNSLFFWITINNCKQIAFNYQNQESERDVTKYIKGKRIFDDLGTEDLAFGKTNVIEYILEMRYLEQINRFQDQNITSFTTNLSLDQIGDFYGFRVKDRLKEQCNFIEISGESFRK